MQNDTETKLNKKRVSILGIIEIIILLFGTFLSITGTLAPLKYSMKYAWCFVFALLGLVFVAIMIILLRRKFVVLIGLVLIIIYFFAAGWAYIICEMNMMRLARIAFYEDKEVILTVDGSTYEWDGKSVSYSDEGLLPVDTSDSSNTYIFTVNGEDGRGGLYKDATGAYYVQTSPSGTGIYLIFSND